MVTVQPLTNDRNERTPPRGVRVPHRRCAWCDRVLPVGVVCEHTGALLAQARDRVRALRYGHPGSEPPRLADPRVGLRSARRSGSNVA